VPRQREWTRERVVDAVTRWDAEAGVPPTVSDWTPTRASTDARARFAAGDWPHASTVRNVYGTFAAALRAAGVTPGRLPYRRIKRARTRLWTEEQLIERLQAWEAEYGEPPTYADWDPALARRRGQDDRIKRFYAGRRWPSASIVARAFGGWQPALRAAGLHVRAAGGTNE